MAPALFQTPSPPGLIVIQSYHLRRNYVAESKAENSIIRRYETLGSSRGVCLPNHVEEFDSGIQSDSNKQ